MRFDTTGDAVLKHGRARLAACRIVYRRDMHLMTEGRFGRVQARKEGQCNLKGCTIKKDDWMAFDNNFSPARWVCIACATKAVESGEEQWKAPKGEAPADRARTSMSTGNLAAPALDAVSIAKEISREFLLAGGVLDTYMSEALESSGVNAAITDLSKRCVQLESKCKSLEFENMNLKTIVQSMRDGQESLIAEVFKK